MHEKDISVLNEKHVWCFIKSNRENSYCIEDFVNTLKAGRLKELFCFFFLEISKQF